MNNQITKRLPALQRTAVLTAITLLAGCSLMPTYERPAAPIASQWPASAAVNAPGDSTGAQSVTALAWQDYFTDPTLRQLIDTALLHNRDLRVAILNIELARAQLGIRQADQWPILNAAAQGSRVPTSDGAINRAYSAGLTVTAYEIDFFGRVASLKEQALAQYLASAEASQSAQISLIATVAQSWMNLLADEELLAVSHQTLASRDESLKLVELRVKHGAASDFELRGAQTLRERARVVLALQLRQRALDENALVLLLGQPLDEASRAQLKLQNLGQASLAELPAGLPSDLLVRRPDIRQAEQLLMASNANIGAARAAFFPRISLTAGAGSASSELAGLFKGGAWGWTLAPQLVLPIFDAGRNQSNLDAARAGREIAVAQYEKAIQNAFREVSDALASRATLKQQLQASQSLLEVEEARNTLTQLRLDNGVANQLEWLDAKRALFAVQLELVQTRLAYQQSQIALFKALGGGAAGPTLKAESPEIKP
ncbi:efflux transporter outer membrane subunit [Rhodoferax sp.]|uniref:efflux transporter outer membrane subunit n=1 Tax=Rhodoferax sp. TaxID=50421 RepID=UPI0025DED18C|nr:efflux transporter outer membrane subunit [Rhodoferax sp.]